MNNEYPKPFSREKSERQEIKDFFDCVLPGTVKFLSDHYLVGDSYRCVWSVREYPPTTDEQGLFSRLADKNGVTLRIYHRLVEATEQRKIIQNATRKNKMKSLGSDVTDSIEAAGNLQDVVELLAGIRKSRECLLHVSVFIELKAKDLETLKNLQSEVQMELARSKISVDRLTLRQKEGFLSVLPWGANLFGTQYERVLPASSAANFYPFGFSGKTDPQGLYIGRDKFGTNILVDLDRRSEDKTTSNVLILGNSGQGKSYLLKLLLCNLRESGKKVICLDPEQEYAELCENLGGCYIDFLSGEYKINPLEPKAWTDAPEEPDAACPEAFKKVTRLSQHIAFLKDFFRAYKDFDDVQLDTIEILLAKLYVRFGITDTTDYTKLNPTDYPIMEDFYHLCEEEFLTYDKTRKYLYTETTLQEVCLGIHSMCLGAESKYFNGATNITDGDFLCFGVKGLMDTNKRLKDAMLFNTTTNDNQHGEVDVREGNLPSVLNYYVSTVGVKEDLPYEQFEYNGGAANINLINGAVTASFSALSIDVPTNPIALELVYNDYYDEIMTEFGMHKMFGNNIKINFQQGIKRETKAVRYVDADGSIDTLGQEGGAYYSVNRNMTYNINANALFIGGKTKLLFDGNKSYRYYDASFIHKEKLMYEIFYSGSKITQIAGYTEGVKTHYISFTYSGDRVIYAQSYMAEDVISGYPFQLLARCDFSYDADGNLTQIKNYNSNSVKFKFEYNEGQLYGLTDFDGNGYLFGRAHWTNPSPMRMSIINYIYGNSPAYDDYYRYDYVSFSADAKVSNVTYYDADGNKLGERSVSRRFAKGVQSGWYKDDKGETAISTVSSSMTGDGNREYLTYTQNIYSTIQKQNTTLSASSYSINPGSSLSGSISTNHGIVSKSGRQYCISLFLYSYGTTFAEILVNGTSRGKISLNGATKSYFIIPVSYYSGATSIQIKNTGNNYLDVSDVSYNYYTSTQIKKRIETMSVFNYVNFVENRGLDYRQTVRYDFLGQITSASETDYSGTTATTKNYTYTYEEYPNITTRSEYDAKRIKSISDGTKEITYEYSSSGVLNNKITTITKDGGTNISKTVSETNGALGEYFTIQTKNGITVRTDYGIKGGNVQPYKITSGNSVIEYEYNYNGQITKVKENGKLVQQTNYSNGKESSFNLGSTESYALVRDSLNFGLVTGINHNGSRKLTIDYNDNGDVNLTTYANGATIEYTYDYRELQSVELKDSPSAVATNIAYGYTGKDLTSVTQSRNGVTQLAYQFTDSKTQAKMTVSGDLNASYTYNYDEETGWLTNRTINLENSKTRTEWFTFDGHGVLQSQGNIDHKTLYGYDSLDRLSTKTQVVGSIERQKLQYNYISTTEYQTNRISSIYNITNSSRQTYSYNNRGYISSYNNTLNGDSYSYIYDGAGRLTSDGKYTYAYDTLNNITSKTSSGSTTEYGYWSGSKTRLQYISENGIKRYFSYDTMGNITNYKGSSTTSSQNLYWTRGNMLSHGNIQSGKNFSYQYGADNLRYSKTVNGEETLYYWDGDVLVGEKTGANYTQYLYDASGIIGMIYNGAYYYFEKNLFGDVLKAYNVSGTSVASFQYDSYGNVLSKSGSMWDKVHFRYRGYYYDEETSFYYLQSRYYDPSICRFISADQYELIGALSKSLGELNLYSYCANNPIIYTDGSGQSIIFWLILGSIVASGLITGFSAMNNSIEGESKLGAFIGGFVDGAVGAASLAAGIATGGIGGFFVTIGGSFIGGFTGNVINQLISYGNVDPKISAAQGFFSALTNGVIYVGFSFNMSQF